VPRHDEVRVSRDHDDRGIEPARCELVELVEQDFRIDDTARADQRRLAGDDTARKLPQLERLAFGDDRVTRVGAALIAAHEVRLLREQVDDLALPFVSPLRTYDHYRRHVPEH
jgi:hypothetical protein